MMFNRNTILSGAALNPAVGPPATIGERAAIDSEVFAETSMSLSANMSIEREYQRAIETVSDATGRRLMNPMMRFRMGGEATLARAEQRFAEELAAERTRNPDLELPLVTADSVRSTIAERRAELRERQADITRRSIGFPVNAAGVLATMGTAIVDPPILLSMAFGAPFASGILRGALIDAGIAAGVEIPVQTAVQFSRRQFGEQPSFGEGLTAVAVAGGGGFLFSGLLRAGARAIGGTRALLNRTRELPEKTAEVKAAESFLARKVELEETTPFGPSQRAQAEHVARVSEADLAIREGRISDMPEAPSSPVRPELKRGPAAGPAKAEEVLSSAQIGETARKEALDRLRIAEGERAAVEAIVPLLDEPDSLAALHADLRAKPAPIESLLRFLQREGGIREERGALRALGLPRARPGLLRKAGQAMDDAALAATEAGFFPGRERASIDDLVEAIREELHGQKVVRVEDADALAEQEGLRALDEGLLGAGIDVRKIGPEDFAGRIREAQRAVADRVRGEEAAQLARGGADRADVEERLAIMADEDLAAEADLRARYEGREEETIVLEGEDGVERLTVAQMFEQFEREAEDLAVLKICGGGA